MNTARAQALAAAIAAFPTVQTVLDDLVSASIEAGILDVPGGDAGQDAPPERAGVAGAWDAFAAPRA